MAPTLPRPSFTLGPPSSSSSSSSSATSSSSKGSNRGPRALTSSSSDEDQEAASRERPAPCNQCWSFRDEVKILTVLAAELRDAGVRPGPSALLDALLLAGLSRKNPKAADVAKKLYGLREKFRRAVASGGPQGRPRDRQLYELSKEVWPELLPPPSSPSPVPTSSSSSSSSAGTE
ncbi:hypothetical protein ACP70R_009107 [Stipagrostis hirtigluma subsp. patula]